MKTEPSQYDHQAQSFLSSNGLRLRATLSDSKPAPWSPAGHHYRVSIWREKLKGEMVAPYQGLNRITFDYFGSQKDAEEGKAPTAYSILACISSDAYTPDTFEEFCNDFGADPDSLKELQAFRRCASFARRLRAFFTPAELEQLSEIQ